MVGIGSPRACCVAGWGVMSETADTATLPGKLAAEISRVTALRGDYEEAGRLAGPMANMRPAIFMMTQSLKAAIAAAGSPDIQGQIAAVRDLEGYTA